VKIKTIQAIIIREAALQFFDEPKKFQNIKTHVELMSNNDLLKLANKHKITTHKVTKLQESFMGSLGTTIAAIAYTPYWLAYRGIKSIGDRCIRRCGSFGFKTQRWQICVIKCDEERAKKAIQLVRKAAPHCDESKNPKRCHRKVQVTIGAAEKDIAYGRLKIAKYARTA